MIQPGKVLQAQIQGGPLDIGAVVLIGDPLQTRKEIRLFAGSSTDYNLNTECNGGQPITTSGVVSCDVNQVSYIQIVNDNAGFSFKLSEIYIYGLQDVAQHHTSSSNNGLSTKSSLVTGILPVGDPFSEADFSSFSAAPGQVSFSLDQNFASSQVMIYAMTSGLNPIKVFAEDSNTATVNECATGTISDIVPFFANCPYSADKWVIQVQQQTESIQLTNFAVLVPLCSMPTKASFTFQQTALQSRDMDLGHGREIKLHKLKFGLGQIIEPASCGWTLQSDVKIYSQISPAMVEYTGSVVYYDGTLQAAFIKSTDLSLTDQVVDYYFTAQVNDPGGTFLKPALQIQVSYHNKCSTEVIDAFTMNDVTTTYKTPSTTTFSAPTYPLQQSLGVNFCRAKKQSYLDLDTSTQSPIYATINEIDDDTRELVIDAANDISLVGPHNVRLTNGLELYPTATSSFYDFVVTFTCDPSETNELTIINAVPSLSFVHDTIAGSATTAQLSTYTLTPGTPCQTFVSIKVYRKSDNTDMSSILSVDQTTSVLTITGNGSEPFATEIVYQAIVEVQSPLQVGNLQHVLDEFKVVFTQGGPCTLTTFVSPSSPLIFEKVMNSGQQTFTFNMPYQLELDLVPTDCNARSTSYIVDDGVGGTVSYVNVQTSATSDVITIIVNDPDPTLMAGDTVVAYMTTTKLDWYQQVTSDFQIQIKYKCSDQPVPFYTTSEVFPTQFQYSLTQSYQQYFLGNTWQLKPDNCNFQIDQIDIVDRTDPLSKFIDTAFVFDLANSEIELTIVHPLAEPFKHAQTLSYEFQIQSSNSVTSTVYTTIEGLDLFDVLYTFDSPGNAAYECSQIGSVVDALSIAPGKTITYIYSVDSAITESLTENTDVVGRMFGDPSYCGHKTHSFRDQETNELISWVSYDGDSLGSGTLTVNPLITQAAGIKSYTIEWTTRLTNYPAAVSSPVYILTIDVQCPSVPSLTLDTAIDLSAGFDYYIDSGLQIFDATSVIDQSNGFCFTFQAEFINSGTLVTSIGSYNYGINKYEFMSSDSALAGTSMSLQSRLLYNGNTILTVDSFTIRFNTMSYDCTVTVLDSAFYTDPGTPYIHQLQEQPASSFTISEPSDSVAVTAGLNYACGQRSFTVIDTNTNKAPDWLSVSSNNDLTFLLDVDTVAKPDSVLGSYSIQIDIGLADYTNISPVSITVNIDIVCPDDPISYDKVDGVPQSMLNPFVFDISQDPGTIKSLSLEQYELRPVACGFTAISSVYDQTSAQSADGFISTDYTKGQVNISWDGIAMDRHEYKWSVTLYDSSEQLQTFSVLYKDLSLVNCTQAVWPTQSNIPWAWVWGNGPEIIDIPPILTDLEQNFQTCGPRTAKISYVSNSAKKKFFKIVNDDSQIKASYGQNGDVLRQYYLKVLIKLKDWPKNKGIEFKINVDVSCPAMHTYVGVNFNNTQTLDPKIYYENLGVAQIFPMNTWALSPRDNSASYDCFSVSAHYFEQQDTGLDVTFLKVINFNQGLIEITSNEAALAGLTKQFDWKVDLSDGTSRKLIQTFSVIFKSLDDCTETALQQGFPSVTLKQKMFETNIPRHPFPVVSDTYADKVSNPSACGDRQFRLVTRSSLTSETTYFKKDMAALEYWLQFNNQYSYAPSTKQMLLEVTLVDYPEVTPMFQYYFIDQQCPDFHHSIYNDKKANRALKYNVTEAGIEQYEVQDIDFRPPGTCFHIDDIQVTDTNGQVVSYASVSGNEIVINQAGNKEWSWLANPITLNLVYTVSDGVQLSDVMTFTVQGVSNCTTSGFDPLAPVALQTQVGQPAAQLSLASIYDQLSDSLSIADYCGPIELSITQTDPSSGVAAPFTKGSLHSPSHGSIVIDFDQAIYYDPIQTWTFEVTMALKWFPSVGQGSQVVSLEYLCPTTALLEVQTEMPTKNLIYSVTSDYNLVKSLPLLSIYHCSTITRTYAQDVETQIEPDFFTFDSLTNEINLHTLDLDHDLRGTTREFKLYVDASDGQIAVEIGIFTVKFIAKNELPYFEPALESNFVLDKAELNSWNYTLPEFFDSDIKDELSVKVNLGKTEDFVVFDNSTFTIVDLKNQSVPEGDFSVSVILTDGVIDVYQEIAITIIGIENSTQHWQVPNITIQEPEKNGTEVAGTDFQDTPQFNQTVIKEEPVEEVFNETALISEEQVIENQIFEWKSATLKKEKSLIDSGAIYNMIPPQPHLKFIASNGEVEISFSQDMRIVPDLDMINKATVQWQSQSYPILEINIIASPYSDPQMLQFSWLATEMTERSVKFQLDFKDAIYVSQQYESDILQIKFRDPYLFTGTNSLAISEKELWEHLQDRKLEQLDENQVEKYEGLATIRTEDDFIILEKELPPQIPKGGIEEVIQEALGSATQGSKLAMASNFAINILVSASLNQLWAMINTQQLMIMMPLFRITMPANAALFFRSLMEIAAFDFYDFSDIVHELLQIEPTEAIDVNFEQIGFESQYFLVNIGSLLAIFLIYASCMPIVPMHKFCKGSCKKFCKNMHFAIYWRVLITLINESYIFIVVCVLINIQVFSMDSYGLTVMSVLSVVFLFGSLAVPTCFICKLNCRFNKLNNRNFRRSYGPLYADLRVSQGRMILIQPIFFLLRRVMLAIACCLVGKVFIWQIMLMTAQIITQVIIIGSGVYVSKAKAAVEYFNEVVLMMLMYTIFVYTPWVSDVHTKFYMGYVTIGFAILHLVINLTLIFGSSAINVKKNCRVKMVMRRYRQGRKKNQKWLAESHSYRLEKRLQLQERKEKQIHVKQDLSQIDSESEYESSCSDEDQAPPSRAQVASQLLQPIQEESDVLEIAKDLQIPSKSESKLVISHDNSFTLPQRQPNNDLSDVETNEQDYQGTTQLNQKTTDGVQNFTKQPLMKAETIDGFEKETNSILNQKKAQLLTGLPSNWPFESNTDGKIKLNQVQSQLGKPMSVIELKHIDLKRTLETKTSSKRVPFAHQVTAEQTGVKFDSHVQIEEEKVATQIVKSEYTQPAMMMGESHQAASMLSIVQRLEKLEKLRAMADIEEREKSSDTRMPLRRLDYTMQRGILSKVKQSLGVGKIEQVPEKQRFD